MIAILFGIKNIREGVSLSKTLKSLLLVGLLVLLTGSVFAAKSVYPLTSNVTLKYWMPLHANVQLVAKNFGDTEFAKELAKRTGVKAQFLHPATGNSAALESFNLMMASGDLPDLIEYRWFDIPGGPNSAIENGYIFKLNPIMDKYAPNLKAYLKKNPQYNKMVKTDEGSYYVFPFIRGDESLISTAGPIVRQDWLDELGLKSPETLDEWYNVLKTFRDKKGAPTPLSVLQTELNGAFQGGADSFDGFYVDKGKVRYGSIEPARKQYFEIMNKWYKEGLLDKNFATVTRKVIDANILGGKSGATYGSGGSGLGRYMEAMQGKDDKFSLVATKYPSPKKGQLAKFANRSAPFGPANDGNVAISTKCKNVEAAARMLDYAYSQEGNLFYNFGIEGITYKMVDKYPKYTELILNNPDKMSPTQIMSKYMRGCNNGPFVQDKRYLEQYYALPAQKAAMTLWKSNDFGKYKIPPITPTPKESEELAKLINEINTYNDEMTLKFIMGVEPIANFDKYVAQIKKLGIDRAIAINQAAYNRYQNRK